jgi:uncharacterized protein YutE (UPF0331/DUF86 family)
MDYYRLRHQELMEILNEDLAKIWRFIAAIFCFVLLVILWFFGEE